MILVFSLMIVLIYNLLHRNRGLALILTSAMMEKTMPFHFSNLIGTLTLFLVRVCYRIDGPGFVELRCR